MALRIVHVMDHSLPRGDGYCIRAKYLLEAQAAAGHQVTVLTGPSQGTDAVDQTIGAIDYRRTYYSRSEGAWVQRGAKHAVFGKAITRSLRALMSSRQFDVIHAHTPFTVAQVALRAARRAGLPFIYEKRNLWEESARARGKLSGRWPFFQLARSMDLLVTRRADAVCTITEALRQHTINQGVRADRVVVVGNGVDVSAFVPRAAPEHLRQRCLGPAGSFVVGFIGSLFSFEGLPLLVNALQRVRTDWPGVRLVIVGDGEDRLRLQGEVQRLNLQDSVWLVGAVPHAEVANFYACMDLLVYPRYRSDLTDMISPLKPLEPMAMARPVLGSDVGGIRELVRDGENGLLFHAGDVDDLAQKLSVFASGKVDAGAMGLRARDFVSRERQWAHMAQAYDEAYRRAGVGEGR